MADMPKPVSAVVLAMVAVIAGQRVCADDSYQKPAAEIVRVLDAPLTPEPVVSPTGKDMLLMTRILYPPVAEMARPMLRLAGLRIDPENNGPHNQILYGKLGIRRLDKAEAIAVDLPPDSRVTAPLWSPDGSAFAFTRVTPNAVELWVGDDATGQVHEILNVRVNAALSGSREPEPVQWMPDNRTLLVETIPADRGAPPELEAKVPPGPHTQESAGKAGPAPTYEDLLKNERDEALFDYYATAQLLFVDCKSGQTRPVGAAAIFTTVAAAPDGDHILVARVQRPYSYFHPVNSFAKEVEVWNQEGRAVSKVASLPVADRVPIEGVPTGPREYGWVPTAPATLFWVEALDGGNPKEQAPHRDRIVTSEIKVDSSSAPNQLTLLQERFESIDFGESGHFALVTDYDRKKRWVRTFTLDPRQPQNTPKLIWSRNILDRYGDPGVPVERMLPNGQSAMRQDGGAVFLRGLGATPQGDRPFLRRCDFTDGKTTELFRSDVHRYETAIAVLDARGDRLLLRRESPTDPPNYFVRTLSNAKVPDVAVTDFPDPAPALRQIRKQLVTYKRADGVPLSFTLYLPPGYQDGTRLPTVVWAYPYEYTDATTAGQVTGSTQRFTTVLGPSEIFFALAGYAVLDNAAMPVIGDPETVNNSYLNQIVADAQAAVDKAVEMGVTDRQRIGVAGHSYGAFMTANLLAHSTLFRAGIARSGAYNRTLTPFGFQNEHRTLWEAPEVYLKMSPFLSAEKIKRPLLLIHGEADDNTGTFPIQSERMYAALRGNGATVRLVTLPYEAHAYRGRESVEHTLYEMIGWFDKYVKAADAGDGKIQSAHSY